MHRIDLPAWAVERGRRMNCFPRIDPARTALLAIDLQRSFTRVDGAFGNPHAVDILAQVNELAAAMRRAGGHVVWTRQTILTGSAMPEAHPDWHYDRDDPFVRRAMASLADGADGHRLDEALDVREVDIVLNKYRYSAFIRHASDVEERLQALGVETLIIVGTLTNVCCESTARDAYMLGYKILFASDATAAITDAEQNAALLNVCLNFADVRTTAELIGLISRGAD